jgi:predicted RNA-binding Zn-ribbon protein involved in translation (DUF1610 family)
MITAVHPRKDSAMPTSIDPQPGEDEFECANCGAYVHYELSRCPNCGINLYEPDDETDEAEGPGPRAGDVFDKLKDIFHKTFNKPYSAGEIFGGALDQSVLYNDLLQKVGGDPSVVERLVEYERAQAPQSTRKAWLQGAIRRWDNDNRV